MIKTRNFSTNLYDRGIKIKGHKRPSSFTIYPRGQWSGQEVGKNLNFKRNKKSDQLMHLLIIKIQGTYVPDSFVQTQE